jgi:hypothetical protein
MALLRTPVTGISACSAAVNLAAPQQVVAAAERLAVLLPDVGAWIGSPSDAAR